VLARLQSLLANPNSDLGDVATLLRLDAAMTTRVIKISNSTWYGRGQPCHTIEEAVNRIGFREVFQVVSIAASSAVVAQPLAAYGRGAIRTWRESVACALAGELLAESLGEDTAASFMNGLLHAIGRQAFNRYASLAGKSLADAGFPSTSAARSLCCSGSRRPTPGPAC
jgi:HD-like signal output (HDOD) protein